DIYGTYVLESGEYQYSLLDLVTKNFRIEKGSSISWSGNPLDGRMNVTAHYETKASVYELVQEQGTILSGDAEQAARTRVPVDVLLYVRGELAAPRITFDINLPESEGTLADNLVSQRISQIRGNQTELNRQVVSLIAFNRFMSTGQGVTGISGGDVARTQVAESVSQLLNEQLGRLTEQYIKGIDLDVSFEALDPGYGAFAQKARVSASKRINDRITIRAGGNVNVGATSGTGHIAGDYYGYYRINKSGSLNFKFFRTGLQTIYTSTLYSMSGASISYRRDFNRWKSIFRKDWQEDNNSNEEEKNQSEE
ncbi:MAG TPA: translocation/assembly module TamB domain-containing protein, partial [Cytophagaceae bacterium]